MIDHNTYNCKLPPKNDFGVQTAAQDEQVCRTVILKRKYSYKLKIISSKNSMEITTFIGAMVTRYLGFLELLLSY